MDKLWWSRRKKNFRIDYYRGSGKGGQHRNKTDSACRITDIETGLFAASEEHKSQPQNKKSAFRKLIDKLMKHYEDLEPKKPARNTDRTRSYHEPEDRVTDHVTGLKYSYKKTVGRQDISEIIEDRLKFQAIERLKK